VTQAPFDAAAEAASVEDALRDLGAPQRAVSAKAYLKSDLEFTGTSVPAARALIRSWCDARPALAHDELIAAARALWARPPFECRMAAALLLDRKASLLTVGDIGLLEKRRRSSSSARRSAGSCVRQPGAVPAWPPTGSRRGCTAHLASP
jgi:hypothetical protein